MAQEFNSNVIRVSAFKDLRIMIGIAAIIALLIFIYITRYMNRKREERRASRQERRQEIFERTLETLKKSGHDTSTEKDTES